LDAEPQSLDRLNKIVAFRRELGALRLNFSQFLICAEVDRTKPFTFPPQALKLLFDFRKIRQWIGRTDFG